MKSRTMDEWKEYRKKGITSIRPYIPGESMDGISIGAEDKQNGSPKKGDYIARDPENHADQWLVSANIMLNYVPLD